MSNKPLTREAAILYNDLFLFSPDKFCLVKYKDDGQGIHKKEDTTLNFKFYSKD